jgi:hypothetical protein
MVNFLTLLAFVPLAVLAVPSLPSAAHLPLGARTVAFDEVNKRLIAFDHQGRSLGDFPITAGRSLKRAEGTCTPMSNDDIAKIPGIQALRDEADKQFGTGDRNEVVNDADFPESPANVCSDDAGVVLVYDGEPACKDLKNEAAGTLEGGKIFLENNEGVSMTSTTEVTRSAAFGVGTKVAATFKFPLIADVSTEITTTSTVTNTQGSSEAVTQDLRTLQRIEQTVDEGQDCTLSLTTKTCSIVGKGSLKMIATGILWFQFEDKTNGHFKWALVMEAILPNIDDRSTVIDFKSTGSIESSGSFAAEGCTAAGDVAVPA